MRDVKFITVEELRDMGVLGYVNHILYNDFGISLAMDMEKKAIEFAFDVEPKVGLAKTKEETKKDIESKLSKASIAGLVSRNGDSP